MPRSYRNIKMYEKEIFEMRSKGVVKRKICEALGFNLKQLTNFITRYNTAQRKAAAGIALMKKGRPSKDYVISEADKVNELEYILARKESKIRQLEMENELMRDFLSHTERK